MLSFTNPKTEVAKAQYEIGRQNETRDKIFANDRKSSILTRHSKAELDGQEYK